MPKSLVLRAGINTSIDFSGKMAGRQRIIFGLDFGTTYSGVSYGQAGFSTITTVFRHGTAYATHPLRKTRSM